MRLLLVEDNVAIADEIHRDCKRAGYAVDWFTDGRDAEQAGLINQYDLIILDIGLPGKSGLEILQIWRNKEIQTPVLVLTARDQWSERIAGLKAGADDYLAKPFHPEELQLRLKGLVRRTHGFSQQQFLSVAGLQLDESAQTVKANNVTHTLKGSEFKLLRYFMLHPNKIISKTELAEHLYDEETERDSNVLEVMINQLRKKIGKDAISTHRGQGYRLETNQSK